jgi:hypothetical protein
VQQQLADRVSGSFRRPLKEYVLRQRIGHGFGSDCICIGLDPMVNGHDMFMLIGSLGFLNCAVAEGIGRAVDLVRDTVRSSVAQDTATFQRKTKGKNSPGCVVG